MDKRLHTNKLHPTQIIIAGYLALILLGAVLLSLPIATAQDKDISFLDACFTSTSAVCVTGLVVVDTGTVFTLFGQIVILFLIQIGGLGFMTIMTLVFILVGKRITLSERMIIKEALNEFNLSGLVKMILKILIVTLLMELFGALAFSTRFVPMYGLKGIYYSVFHSVSAFCNAGFDVLGRVSGEFSSMSAFISDPVVNLTLIFLIVMGGLGFVVVTDIFSLKRIRSRQKLTRYSRLVLATTAILIGAGLISVFLLELSNGKTLGADGVDAAGKIFGGIFQAITPRTAGFSTIDQGAMMPATKLITIVLMFIGASPAGTGGGIKTTTIAVVLMYVFSGIRGRKDVTLKSRRIAEETIKRAITITVLGIVFILGASFILIAIEGQRGGLFTFENIFFEAFSAFGTVGLSSGITPMLSGASRVIIMIIMFAGRVGLMTLTLAFANRSQMHAANIRYPEERFMVG
ncbi:MAG: TrkH family potassium uptake protein [Eubacteriales bacterium]|nr:TrkH family potassium uptake protein [Eubacteriales bacterium]